VGLLVPLEPEPPPLPPDPEPPLPEPPLLELSPEPELELSFPEDPRRRRRLSREAAGAEDCSPESWSFRPSWSSRRCAPVAVVDVVDVVLVRVASLSADVLLGG
jgi:hypothetical protein